ncbi:MAG: ATP-binding cassette domain-containing protein [Planctomycetota bacterium]
MNAQPLYRLHTVGKSYGDCTILQIDELDLCAASVFCLLGPTGAGKSTLLKLLAGLQEPTCGVVRFDGVDLNRRDLSLSVRRRIAMVHQRPYLLTGTVRFNVEYGLRIRRASDRPQKVKAILERLGVEALANQSAQTLSGGQVQLVALARALVIEPEVLLLDEPTANLDPARVALVENVVRETQEKAAIVWATHNLFQARRAATRVGLLWNGQLVEVASTEQFFQSPSDARTRAFVEGRAIY